MKTPPLLHTHTGFAAITVAALLFTGIVLVFSPAFAGTKFRIRGTVREVDTTNKVITVNVTHIEKGWPAVRFEKSPYTVRISNREARVWKYDASGKRVRLSIGSITVNGSVNVIGETRSDGTLDAKTVILR